MIPEIGNLALTFALSLAVIQFVVPMVGVYTNRWRWVLVARPAAWGQFVFVAIAMLCLGYSFYVNDFSVEYVAMHSNSKLPTAYRITAIWGGHEGSFLLWVFMLSSWTLALSLLSNSLPALTRARVLSVMGALAVGFIAFIILTSNPFDRIIGDFPLDGKDLNPLLQDPGMVIHPPMLYMGYVGFSVAFAFAIVALIEGHIDALWARWVRPWAIAAWLFLTAGVTLGSWWAYYELGWGGWWFWDPVENASFMPWLLGTALIHSLAATEKRGVFKAWTILLAISVFSFSLLGTFLVRSGVITSVHSFASDPVRGLFILGFLGLVVGASLILFAVRASSVSVSGWFDWLSRELLLLLNNLILAVVTIIILMGTLYPILADFMDWGAVSVGAPYFNLYFTLFMTPLLFLVGFGSLTNWRQQSFKEIRQKSIAALTVSLSLGVLIAFLQDNKSLLESVQIFIGMFLTFWILSLTLTDFYYQSKTRSGFKPTRIAASYYGMYFAHLGLASAVLGIVLSSHLSEEKNVRLGPGHSIVVSGYSVLFKSINAVSGANYSAMQGEFEIREDGELISVLRPEKRQYFASGQSMTEAAIDPALSRDIYVALGEPLQGSTDWAVRIYVKPFVRMIWFGGVLMVIGGLLALSDRRYRRKIKQKFTKDKSESKEVLNPEGNS
jgi:cytochrome c-type biogenesis protein CcmF